MFRKLGQSTIHRSRIEQSMNISIKVAERPHCLQVLCHPLFSARGGHLMFRSYVLLIPFPPLFCLSIQHQLCVLGVCFLFYSLGSCFQGVPRSGALHLKQQRQNFSGICTKMASGLGGCDGVLRKGTGVVLPAMEEFAGEAVEVLSSGKVIAVPTDTLYGFACDVCSREAVNSIYEIKGRKHTSPLAICVGDVSDIKRFAATDHLPGTLLNALLPGPVTVVLRRGESSILEKSLNPGLDSIGVRVPDCNFVRIVSRRSGSALALTSANLSGQPSSVCIKDFKNLWEHYAYVFDGGELPMGQAGSTVVDLTRHGIYKILRPGSAREETAAILQKYGFQEEGTHA